MANRGSLSAEGLSAPRGGVRQNQAEHHSEHHSQTMISQLVMVNLASAVMGAAVGPMFAVPPDPSAAQIARFRRQMATPPGVPAGDVSSSSSSSSSSTSSSSTSTAEPWIGNGGNGIDVTDLNGGVEMETTSGSGSSSSTDSSTAIVIALAAIFALATIGLLIFAISRHFESSRGMRTFISFSKTGSSDSELPEWANRSSWNPLAAAAPVLASTQSEASDSNLHRNKTRFERNETNCNSITGGVPIEMPPVFPLTPAITVEEASL